MTTEHLLFPNEKKNSLEKEGVNWHEGVIPKRNSAAEL
jgi:hypothetical protein